MSEQGKYVSRSKKRQSWSWLVAEDLVNFLWYLLHQLGLGLRLSSGGLAKSWSGVPIAFESPVPRLEKDWDWTGPRLEKTGPAVQVFDFWESKTRKRPVFMDWSLQLRPVWTSEFVPLIYPFKTSPRSPKTVNIWLRNKINYAMLTKIVDFAEYYCRKFKSQPYLMILGSFQALN